MDSWFEITLRLPNILNLSDQEMQRHFWALDGRWSEQTKALVKRYSAKGLALNSNWALVRQNWTCPCCGRDKPGIVRLTPNGMLLASLEQHHDHIREWVDRTFDPRLGQIHKLLPEEVHAHAAARTLAARFSDELICGDCNAADGLAKLNTNNQIDKHFSFSPKEIRGFISVTRNKPHSIDIAKALEIWNEKKFDFDARKALVGQLVERTAQGLMRRERAFDETRSADIWLGGVVNRALTHAMQPQPEKRAALAAYQNFVIRSTLNDGAGQSAAKKKTRPAQSPTDVEFAALDAVVAKICRPWREASQGWRCDCCGRSQREICRKSNAGKWTARIFRHSEFTVETDPAIGELRRAMYPMFIPDPMIGAEVQFSLCQDCSLISTQLQSQRPELTDQFYLTISDMRDSITSIAANRNHERDLSIAADRVTANRNLSIAIDAFVEHRSLACFANSWHTALMKSGYTDSESRAATAIRLENERSLPEHALDPFIDWLIDEGDRLRWKLPEQVSDIECE